MVHSARRVFRHSGNVIVAHTIAYVLRVAKLLWNDANEAHLWASHQVTPIEVDEIIFGFDEEAPNYDIRRDGSNYVALGETGDGRLLVIALEPISPGFFRPFAARDMESQERRSYRNRRKTR
jgi:uncharacterized DUF497 family protein